MTTDFRALCAELTGWIERSTRHYIQDPDVLIRARAALDEPVAEGEVAELVTALRADAECAEVEHYDLCNMTADQMRRAADLLEQRHPTPVPVSERLPGAEDCDENGDCWFDTGVDVGWMLCDKVFGLRHGSRWWLPFNALPLPQGEVE